MSPFAEFARQLENTFRWSNLILAQSRLSLMTARLMLRERKHVQTEMRKARPSRARPKRRGKSKTR